MPEIDQKILFFFKDQHEWREWLKKNHQHYEAVWLKFAKKDSGLVSLTYAEALDEALCFGWIDGISKRIDDTTYAQRFTPRRPKSVWSIVNTRHVARLSKAGKMTAAGLAQVEAAQKDGRWQQAYASPSEAKLPADFLRELAHHPRAQAFFNTLSKTNIFSIYVKLQTAKQPATKLRRIKAIIAKLEERKKFY